MIYKVGIWGASGRMGQEVAALLTEGYVVGNDRLELADLVASSARVTSIDGIQVRLPSEPAREPLHVWIDFSRPGGTMNLLSQAKAGIVVGTTGFTLQEKEKIAAFAERYPVCLAPNLSPGMALFRKYLGLGVPAGFDVVMEETHHTKKVDSPSGTALSLAALLKATTGKEPQSHSIRGGGVPGEHMVRFIGEEEEIRIEHRVWNRSVFAKGALLAAYELAKRKGPGLFSFDDLLVPARG